VETAQQTVNDAIRNGIIHLPGGYNIFWSGQYEYMVRAKHRLMIVVPLTLLIIILIIYLNTRSAVKTAIVLLAVPFSLVGAIWILYLLNYNMSVAVWVGLIALAGFTSIWRMHNGKTRAGCARQVICATRFTTAQ
jgi:Cu(I)/Ag(I) efflux system membrane protein CusA/SilA